MSDKTFAFYRNKKIERPLMSEDIFGWLRVEPKPSDHDLAAFLRKKKAIDNFQSMDKSVAWYGPDGKAVAVAFHHHLDFIIYTHTGTLS